MTSHALLGQVGFVVFLLQKCSDGHTGYRWSSQPRMTKRGVHAGDFMLATNIVLSGNNFHKVSLMMKFMNIGTIAHTFYNQVQLLYCAPQIDDYYTTVQVASRESCKNQRLVVAGEY